MSIEANKAIVRRYQDLLNRNDLDALGEVVADNLSMPYVMPGLPPGLEGARTVHRLTVEGMPDFHVAIDDIIAEDDRVAVRFRMTGTQTGAFFGIPPSGRKIDVVGMYLARIANGKIVEHRGVEDTLAFMQHLGVIPPMG